MDNNTINNKFFQKLIERYLDGKTTADELKLLVNYYESFQKENHWVEALGPEQDIKERMLVNILDAIKDESPKPKKVISLINRKMITYGVAAAIVVFMGFYFLLRNNAETANIENNLATTTIQAGTDKAVLTREDGTMVELEKGKIYKEGSVESNGEHLVYNQDSSSTAIAYNYLTIPRGGQFVIKLADGTQVWLNSESQLKYPVSFTKNSPRTVELIYGEAYFDVSPSEANHGTKFKVFTRGQEIEVLGTEFNVKAYADESHIYTTLVEGKVALQVNEHSENLVPNQQAVVNKMNNNVLISTVETKYEIAWKNGLFSFKNKSLKEIMKVLSRWYDVTVVFEDESTENIMFNGQLSKHQNIENILNLIKNTNFIQAYDINNNTITIKK
ncbi:FecR family protein [Neotamlana nanhaiensis]|uniref:FecR family protein n=1 Tax=Neotamlana nanhaiensis TaxID=1382798 RepID=UPI00069A7C3B|nr:FecR family protein [Tamlana nanhaiensis]